MYNMGPLNLIKINVFNKKARVIKGNHEAYTI